MTSLLTYLGVGRVGLISEGWDGRQRDLAGWCGVGHGRSGGGSKVIQRRAVSIKISTYRNLVHLVGVHGVV